jgi:hypothetical protein
MSEANRSITGFRLPERYYRDILRLAAVGPREMYAFWEVSDRMRWLCARHWRRDWSELYRMVRIYDVTLIQFDGDNANRVRDIPVPPAIDDLYVHELQPGTSYIADYGIVNDRAQFIPLLRSKAVLTPQDRPPSGAFISEQRGADCEARQ